MIKAIRSNCLLFILAFATSVSGASMGEEPKCEVEREITSAMGKEAAGGPSELPNLVRIHGAESLPYLYPYLESEQALVKHAATRAIARILWESEDSQLRREVVEVVLPHIDTAICSLVTDLSPADYSDVSRAYIQKRLDELWQQRRPNDVPLRFYVLAAGAAQMNEAFPLLAKILEAYDESLDPTKECRQFSSVGWDALRARARIGSSEDALRAVELVEECDMVNVRLLRFQDLIYVKDEHIVKCFWSYLDRDDAPPSLGKDTVQRSYAAWAADALSKMLKGFPEYTLQTEVDGKGYATVYIKDIKELRRWMAEQMEWHFREDGINGDRRG